MFRNVAAKYRVCDRKNVMGVLQVYKNISKQFKNEHQTCPSSCKPMLLNVNKIFQRDPPTESVSVQIYFPISNIIIMKITVYVQVGRSMTIRLPSLVKVIEANYVYTVLDFAAEFGGYIGTFLGYCLLDLADKIEEILLFYVNFT